MSERPTIGRMVRYFLTVQDAETIAIKRSMRAHNDRGEPAGVSQEFPAMIVRTYPDRANEPVNLQVYLDGPDVHWVSAIQRGPDNGEWHWPERN